jgi:hypothetical protein
MLYNQLRVARWFNSLLHSNHILYDGWYKEKGRQTVLLQVAK